MIAAVAFVPEAPVLVPALAGGAAHELDDLRAACRAAIRRVVARGVRPVVVGAGPAWTSYPASTRGSLAGFGVPLTIPLGSDEPGPVTLPPSLTVGAWLVRDAIGPGSGATGYGVGPAGGQLPASIHCAHDGGPVALLVVGDGSVRRCSAAPGYFDERAADFDAHVAESLRSGQANPLRVPAYLELGAELLASGTYVWDEVAGQIEAGDWDAELLYTGAPYGVGYFAAAWTARG